MEIDRDKIDDAVLALLHLASFEYGASIRSWKGYDWDAMNRLYEKGMIGDPRGKSRSVLLTQEGAARARELFERSFVKTE